MRRALDIAFEADLIAGVEFGLGEDVEAGEELTTGRGYIRFEGFWGVLEVTGRAPALGFGDPLGAVVIAIEADGAAFHEEGRMVSKRACWRDLPALRAASTASAKSWKASATAALSTNHGWGAVRRGAHGPQLNLFPVKANGRGSITVGIVPEDGGDFGDSEGHGFVFRRWGAGWP
jgi:hypothetical protein